MRVRMAVDEFLTFCAVERRLSNNTLEAYTADLRDFEKWLPEDARPMAVTETHLKSYLSELVIHRNLATSTVRRRFACLRAFFRRAATVGYMSDPFATWRPQLQRRKALPRTLSHIELSSLLNPSDEGTFARNNEHHRNLRSALRLMISTGIRVGELCKLQTEDVSPEGSSARIHGKGARDRIVYISDTELQSELKRLVRDGASGSRQPAALFLNRFGHPMQPQTMRARLRRYAMGVGVVRRITPHMLRHTAATLLIETGVDIRFVQRLLGHSSIATTEIYTHVSDEALKSALERANVLANFHKMPCSYPAAAAN
jgi:site-specific recombinase XerD